MVIEKLSIDDWDAWYNRAIENGALPPRRKAIFNDIRGFSYILHTALFRTPTNLPGFMIIGAQKAGTTWLRSNLRCHPEIYLPSTEVHYFDRYNRPIQQYIRIYQSESNKISGDCTPLYSIIPQSRIRMIKRLMPQLKIIIWLQRSAV